MGRRHHQAVLICVLAALLIGCNTSEPTPPDHIADTGNMVVDGVLIYRDDSTEWMVWVPYASVYVYDSYPVDSPFHIPTREEAKILHTLRFGAKNVRYLTDDGYTFGMPSASITKAGQKTKYSVLALYRRPYIINISF